MKNLGRSNRDMSCAKNKKAPKTYPTLVAENPTKHTTTVTNSRAFSHDRSRHRIVSTNTNTEKEAETEKPPHLRDASGKASRTVDGERDNHDNTDNGNKQLLAVDKLAAERITEKTEANLTNDIADVGGRIHSTTDEERNGWGRNGGDGSEVALVEELVGPDGRGKIDDEQVIGVEHKTYTADGVELEVGPGKGLAGVTSFILLEGEKVAVLILAGVAVLLPDRHDEQMSGCLGKANEVPAV